MIRILFFILFSVFICDIGLCQPNKIIDSLRQQLSLIKEDTGRVNIMNDLCSQYFNSNPDSSLIYAQQAFVLAGRINFYKGKAYALKNLGIGSYLKGNYIGAMNHFNQSLEVFMEIKDNAGVSNLYNNIGAIFFSQGDNEKGIENYLNALKFAELSGDKLRILVTLTNLGGLYDKPETQEKARQYYLKAFPVAEALGDTDLVNDISINIGIIYHALKDNAKAMFYYNKALKLGRDSLYAYVNIGKLYSDEGKYELALQCQETALAIAEKKNNTDAIINPILELGKIYVKKHDYKNAIITLIKAEKAALQIKSGVKLKEIYENLVKVYAALSDYTTVYKYQNLLADVKDTLNKNEVNNKLATLQFSVIVQRAKDSALAVKDKEVQQLKFDQIASSNQFRIYFLLGGIGVLLIIAILLFRNIRHKQKANKEIEQAYINLKATQQQLIQSEKMASLGELTAGIAHEIQNPLNFVNNFSDINKELVDELKAELAIGNVQIANEIAEDIKVNEEKINHHGKRADAIVKGMLQHSRSSSGQKEPTDINALCDEYLRLSYHGLRAKDKSFNAKFETNFDVLAGKVEVVPQDIGRVILNLINNAFYAVTERKRMNEKGFEPTVIVSTKKLNDCIEIRVKDNGTGIPKNVLDKIFQPFFTTKPTGQGTGLGLSLSYDIVKAHGGEIKVKSSEGDARPENPVGGGTEFIIQLPLAI